MKDRKIRWMLVVLLLAALACSTLGTGGNNTAANNDNTAAAGSDNTAAASNNTAGNNTAANDTAANDDTAAAGDDDSGGAGIFSMLSTDSTCYNVFFPVNQEVTWTYEASYPGQSPVQYTIAITDVADDTITSTMTFPEFSSTVVWNCGPDGLFSSDFAQFNFAQLGDIVDIETVSYEGLTLPSADLWEVGYSWDSSYEIVMHMEIEGVAIDATATGAFTSVIAAVESVTVPAGTFPQAYRVDVTGTMTMDIMGMATEVPITESTWYVENVGMIKTVSTDEMGESVTVLLSFE